MTDEAESFMGSGRFGTNLSFSLIARTSFPIICIAFDSKSKFKDQGVAM